MGIPLDPVGVEIGPDEFARVGTHLVDLDHLRLGRASSASTHSLLYDDVTVEQKLTYYLER